MLRGTSRLTNQSLDGNIDTLLLSVINDGPTCGYPIVQDPNAMGPPVERRSPVWLGYAHQFVAGLVESRGGVTPW